MSIPSISNLNPLSAGGAPFHRVKTVQNLNAVPQWMIPLPSRIQSLEKSAEFIDAGLLESLASRGQHLVALPRDIQIAPGMGFRQQLDLNHAAR